MQFVPQEEKSHAAIPVTTSYSYVYHSIRGVVGIYVGYHVYTAGIVLCFSGLAEHSLYICMDSPLS